MKLKSIMYALGYGKSRKQLVRSEGARRVKQAEKLANNRRREKSLLFPFRYGAGSDLLNSHLIQQSVQNKDKIAVTFLEVEYEDIEKKLASYVKGRTAGKGGL